MEDRIPENFSNIVNDFIVDLSNTFPEYKHLWKKWENENMKEENKKELFSYFLKIYPERFFDILYQNEEIFNDDSDTDVHFLPEVDFKKLYRCENVSENIQKSLWKYLQIILFTVIGSVPDKSIFGDTMNIFDGIDENELQTKLKETFENIQHFFHSDDNADGDYNDDTENDENDNDNETNNDQGDNPMNIPNPEDIHEHLKGLFDGKIGKLAKELAEDISNDVSGMFGEDIKNLNSGSDILKNQDIIKKLLKDPKKMIELVKVIGNKINKKMKEGEISQDDIMKEATDFIDKMKHMKGGKEFNKMFQHLTKQMGGMNGMSGGGKQNVNINALHNNLKKQSLKEKLKKKLEKKQLEQLQKYMKEKEMSSSSPVLEQTENDVFVFKTGETQEKSSFKQKNKKNKK